MRDQPTHLISRSAVIGADLNILGKQLHSPFFSLLYTRCAQSLAFYTRYSETPPKPKRHSFLLLQLQSLLPRTSVPGTFFSSHTFLHGLSSFIRYLTCLSKPPSWRRLIDNFNLGQANPRLKQLATTFLTPFFTAIDGRSSFTAFNKRELVLSVSSSSLTYFSRCNFGFLCCFRLRRCSSVPRPCLLLN